MATIVSKNVTTAVDGPEGAVANSLARFNELTGKVIKSSGAILDDDDNLSGINELTISNGANAPMAMFNTLANSITTGLLGVGGLLTGATTLFDISDGVGYIVDNYTNPALPVPVRVTWSGLDDITALYVATNDVSYIAIDIAGDVVQSDIPFTIEQRTTLLVLGPLIHPDGVITSTGDQSVEFNASKLGDDTAIALGNLNMFGNNFNAAATDLTIRKEGGETFAPNTNRKDSGTNPNFSSNAVEDPVTFSYVYDDGEGGVTSIPTQTNIDPNFFDDGTGTLQAVSNNQWTNHLCYYFPSSNEVIVRYGTEEFQSLSDARSAAFEVPETIGFDLNPENVRSILSVEEGETDLTNILTVAFSNSGRFGLGSGGGTSGGGVFQNRQDTYDNSSSGIVVTDGTRGALGAQVGSGSDTDNVLELKNIAGTDVLSVTGEGDLGMDGDLAVAGASTFNEAMQVTADVTVNNLITGGLVDGQDISVAVPANTAKVSYPPADSAKVDFISVTQPVNLDTIESDTAVNNGKISYTDAAAVTLNTAKVSYDDQVAVGLNTAKITNATHTGEMTGDVALSAAPSIITNKPAVAAAPGDLVLISDVNDDGNLKQVTAQSIADLGGAGGSYKSPGQVVSQGGLITLAHGLGVEPSEIHFKLQCVVAGFGYDVGDRIVGNLGTNSSAPANINACFFDATNISVRFSDNILGAFVTSNKATGVVAFIPNGDWDLYVEARA